MSNNAIHNSSFKEGWLDMKRFLMIFLIFTMIFLSGCWDSIEINERNFVILVGVDLNKDPNEEGRYVITYVYPNIGAVGKNPSQKETKFVKSTVAETVFDGSRQLTTRMNNPFFFKHLKVIVIGEELFKEPEMIKEFFDGINRDPRINTKAMVVVAQGTAKDVVSTKMEELAVIGGYLNSMLQNDSVAARFTSQTFSEVIKDFDFCGSTIVPRAVPKKNEFKLSGGAVLKDYKLIGWIGEKENRAIAMVRNKVKSEIIDIPYNGKVVSYIITDASCKKHVSEMGEKIKVDLNIFVEGYIQQYPNNDKEDVFNPQIIEQVQEKVSETIKKGIEDSVNKLQKKYNADAIGIAEYIYKFKPNLWEKVNEDWDEVFPNLDINVIVDTKIRRAGLTR